MQTRSLQTFLTIARTGSFAESADALNMTLSAVSMQMKALEQQLGVDLFDRAFRPPRLTPMARQLIPQARAIVDAEGALWASVRPQDPLAGDFRIGFINTASVRVLPGFLRRARESRPQMQFILRSALSHELEEEVLTGRLDFAVVTGPVDPGNRLASQTLATEPLLFACNARETSRLPAQIARRTTFLQFRPEAGIGRLIARHIAPSLSAESPRPVVLDSVDAILECVKEGVGFTLLPGPDIQRSADARVVAFKGGTRETPVRELCLISRPGTGEVASVVAAILRETLEARAVSGPVAPPG